jgi:hypothetical protein
MALPRSESRERRFNQHDLRPPLPRRACEGITTALTAMGLDGRSFGGGLIYLFIGCRSRPGALVVVPVCAGHASLTGRRTRLRRRAAQRQSAQQIMRDSEP